MNTETHRIADQLRRALSGDAWHGDAIGKLLSGVTAEQAQSRPLPRSHTIWELVLHIELWARIALDATQGVPMPRLYGTEKDWPAATGGLERSESDPLRNRQSAWPKPSKRVPTNASKSTRSPAATMTSITSFMASCSTAFITADRSHSSRST